MHRRFLFGLTILLLLAHACQGPPPTQIILVVTATPGSTPDGDIQAVESEEPTATVTPIPTTATPQVTPTVDPFPTPIINQIQVAEQVFEGGRMFWLQPTQQIWVMIVEAEGRGDWQIFEDTFEDGESEFDPEIVPPEGMSQPERGFGKLWRENPDLREALGWAVTPEFGFVTAYEYHAGGSLDDDGQWVDTGSGYHIITSLYEEAFRFNEADLTWQLN